MRACRLCGPWGYCMGGANTEKLEVKVLTFNQNNGLGYALVLFSDGSEVTISHARFRALENYFENITLDKFLDRK